LGAWGQKRRGRRFYWLGLGVASWPILGDLEGDIIGTEFEMSLANRHFLEKSCERHARMRQIVNIMFILTCLVVFYILG
jgi:hypothetical protein